MNNELYHHGIKGQKWGRRRYQNRDGTRTPLGRAHRYDIEYDRHMTATSRLYRIKKKFKQPLDTLSDKVLGTNKLDSVLNQNTKLSRIQLSPEFEQFAFYATYKKHDVDAYAGMFGANLKRRSYGQAKRDYKAALESGDQDAIAKAKESLNAARQTTVYQLKLKNSKALNVPSDDNGGKITAELIKIDPDFKSDLTYSIQHAKEIMKRPQQQVLFTKAEKVLKKNPNEMTDDDKRSLYRALNLTLVNHDAREQNMQRIFYDGMKQSGYNALVDTNDKEYSSYHAKRPMIVFDLDSIRMASATKMDPKEIDRLNKIYTTERVFKESVLNLPSTLKASMQMSINSISEDYDYSR